MRDPARIKKILAKLEEVWTKYPDMRFCQITESVTYKHYTDLFYLEDDKFLALLEEWAKEEGKPNNL